MDTYQGDTENGKIISLGDRFIPDGCRAIITVLDNHAADIVNPQKQAAALRILRQKLDT
jgi:hypothetical protein